MALILIFYGITRIHQNNEFSGRKNRFKTKFCNKIVILEVAVNRALCLHLPSHTAWPRWYPVRREAGSAGRHKHWWKTPPTVVKGNAWIIPRLLIYGFGELPPFFGNWDRPFSASCDPVCMLWTCTVYLSLIFASGLMLYWRCPPARTILVFMVVADIFYITLLLHASGGVQTGSVR